jgi:hypothetical protein
MLLTTQMITRTKASSFYVLQISYFWMIVYKGGEENGLKLHLPLKILGEERKILKYV